MHYLKAQGLFGRRCSQFLRDQSGATAIEYGLIAGLISVIVITVLTSIGTKINAKFTTISSKLN